MPVVVGYVVLVAGSMLSIDDLSSESDQGSPHSSHDIEDSVSSPKMARAPGWPMACIDHGELAEGLSSQLSKIYSGSQSLPLQEQHL